MSFGTGVTIEAWHNNSLENRRENAATFPASQINRYVSQKGLMATKAEIVEFLAAEYPHTNCTVEAVGGRSATVKHQVGLHELRPGGTVSGPVLMTVADVALYVAILGEIGIVPLAVTTNLSINFMQKPSAQRAIIGVCNLMKMGKSLAVGHVFLYSEGIEEPVAHVVGTYSIPR
jgi:acyl-coenzyme A thioesterase PaaI-like protein